MLHPVCKESFKDSSKVLNLSIRTSWTVWLEQNWLISWLFHTICTVFCWKSKFDHRSLYNFLSFRELVLFWVDWQLQFVWISELHHCLCHTLLDILYRNISDLISLKSNLNLMVLNIDWVTFVMKGIIKWRPGSVHVLSIAPPLL